MRISYFLPSTPFRSAVTIFGIIDDVREPEIHTLPAMVPNLHIRLSGSCTYVFAEGDPKPAFDLSLLGATSRSYRMVLEPGYRMVTVGFLPLGWLRLVRASAGELTDSVIDGTDLWGRTRVDRMVDRLLQVSSANGLASIVEDFLSERPTASLLEEDKRVRAIDGWLERSGSLSLDELIASMDLGQRQLQRMMVDVYGCGPKTLAMKYRALRSAATLTLRGGNGMDDAAAGFADQAHLIRDFKRFVGWTPGRFLRERQNVAAATFAGRRAAGATRIMSLLS